mgnify:CR=1 FL=1
MDVAEKALALFLSLAILGQAYVVRRIVGTWVFPACLFGLFWFGYTFFPLAIMYWVPVEPYSIAFIFVCALAFSIGFLAFDWKSAFESNSTKQETVVMIYGNPFLKIIFYAFTLGSLAFLVINSLAQDITLYDLIFDMFVSSATYAERRSSESVNVNIFGQLSLVLAYAGVSVGGFIYSSARGKLEQGLILVPAFLPSIFVTVTQSAKGLLFLCIFLFYGSILIYRVSAGNLRLFERGSIRSLMIYVAILLPIVTISFMSRGLYESEDADFVIGRLLAYFASYSSGHIYAFSDWFAFMMGGRSEVEYGHEAATYGFYTFMAVFKLMGSDKIVPQGVFDQYYVYGDYLATNIFTMFRGLILDFGFIGATLFMLATGLLLHLTFYAMLTNRRPTLTVAAFVFMMGYFYTSFIISVLIWNSIYISFFLLWIVLEINKLKIRMKKQN